MLKNMKKDFNLEKWDKYGLALITIVSAILIIFMCNFYMKNEVYSPDVFSYLNNALLLSGVPVGDGRFLYLSPIISYLTSLLFRLGIKSELSIFIVTGIFAYFGYIGMYLLLKTRFNSILTLMGTILFMTFSMNIMGIASGMLDLPATGIGIWVILLTVIATEKNPKYFMLVMPFFIIGIFTRYTTILFLPACILYYLLRKDFLNSVKLFFTDRKELKNKSIAYFKSKEFKYIIISLIFSAIISIVILAFITMHGAKLTFLTQGQEVTNNTIGATKDIHYNKDNEFYLKYFPTMLESESSKMSTFVELRHTSLLAYLILGIIGLGVLIEGTDIFFKIKNSYKSQVNFIKSKTSIEKVLNVLLIIAFIINFVLMKVLLHKISIYLIISLIALQVLIIGKIIRIYAPNSFKKTFNLDITITLIGLSLIYLVFFSILSIKVDRYVMPMLIAVAYLFTASIYIIQKKIAILKSKKNKTRDPSLEKKNEKNNNSKIEIKKIAGKIIPIIIIIIFLSSTAYYLDTVTKENYYTAQNSIKEYIIKNIPNYKDKHIATSNKGRVFTWLLKTEVKEIRLKEKEKLEEYKPDYYISRKAINNRNYTLIYKKEMCHLYNRTDNS